MSEQRKYRSWTAQQKLEIVLARMSGDPVLATDLADAAVALQPGQHIAENAEAATLDLADFIEELEQLIPLGPSLVLGS